jgi:photosystem II stability/assembly factor-like uncharacterized protein
MAGSGSTHVYAGAWSTKDGGIGGVYRCEAGGNRWERLTKGLPDVDVQAITVDPSNPDVVYAGTADGPYRSSNRGDSWERLGFPDRDMAIWSITAHPKQPRTLFAGGSPVAVYRSDDNGDNWRRMVDPALPNRVKMPFACRVMRFAPHPTKDDELYATLEVNGVMRSQDRGESWQDCSADLVKLADRPHLKSRLVSDTESEGMLDGHAMTMTPAEPDTVFLAVRMGLFRSNDQGKSWQDMEVGRFSPVTYGRDIRVSPQDPRVLYSCLSVAANSSFGSLYRSDDVGQSWKRVDEGTDPRSTLMAVALHPRDTNQIYTVARNGQVFGTQDRGGSWTEFPLPEQVKQVYALACG